jgi:hypothetical protein
MFVLTGVTGSPDVIVLGPDRRAIRTKGHCRRVDPDRSRRDPVRQEHIATSSPAACSVAVAATRVAKPKAKRRRGK